MNADEKSKLEDFRCAKEIALIIDEGEMRRAKRDGRITNYSGARINNRMFVVGDSLEDIQNPDAMIQGFPAREVFGNFTMMR